MRMEWIAWSSSCPCFSLLDGTGSLKVYPMKVDLMKADSMKVDSIKAVDSMNLGTDTTTMSAASCLYEVFEHLKRSLIPPLLQAGI